MKFIIESVIGLKWYEKLLWILSVTGISLCFFIMGNTDYLTLIASLIGVSGLIFVAKGNVIGQLMTVLFGLLYAAVSVQYRYWSEVITYLGMTAPIALAAVVSWIRHPYSKGEVKVRAMKQRDWIILTTAVTVGFYFILIALSTPNIVFSTISIATSFLAASLVLLRSEYYGIFYALNDIVLIVLWVLAAIENINYLPMVLCFVVFLINDLYGFYNWLRLKRKQNKRS
ncbi:MAG: nicotinamide mononucleotide transporter [Ruminococcus sp.]|nr:nicotinamide mononucleotide transporter [Ruminococcus sp.]